MDTKVTDKTNIYWIPSELVPDTEYKVTDYINSQKTK